MPHKLNHRMDDRFDRLSEALDRGALMAARKILGALHPAEIALALESLPRTERHLVWEILSDEDEGDVLVHLNEEARNEIIASMSTEDLLDAMSELEVDDLADLVGELPETLNQQVLHAMSHADRERLSTVLVYDEDTAGGLMNTDMVTIRPDVSLDVVMRYLHNRGELPPNTDQLFVASRYGRFLGTLPLSVLVTKSPEHKVTEVMQHDVASINATLASGDVANFFTNRDLISAAVVDDQDQIIGRITVDDVIDVVREQADHDVLGRAGLDEDVDMFAPILVSSKRRALWLGINLATAFLAASVVGLFEATIQQVVALAVLMPVVASMGGIAGTQTLTLVTRGLALGQVRKSNAFWLAGKETAVSLLNGVLWALVVGLASWLWFRSLDLAMVIGIALITNMFIAALCGVAIPLIMKRFNIDPAIAGGVVLTTITDVLGFFIFLGLGAWWLI